MTTPDPDPMPTFVLKAQDLLSVHAIQAYREACEAEGLTRQADQVRLAFNEWRDWQRRNPDRLKLPDHDHVPARCCPRCGELITHATAEPGIQIAGKDGWLETLTVARTYHPCGCTRIMEVRPPAASS